MNQIFNHLWQSTVFAAAVALACAELRRNSPRLRYWLWLAASIKFLIPFSLLVSTGARVQMPPDTPSLHAVTVQQISTYFAPASALPTHTTFQWPLVLVAIWLAGSLFLLVRWIRSWREMKTAVLEPGVFGIFQPVLVLPEGLGDRLTAEQLQAVLTHEARHIECFDNLTAALHMIVETIFWFHPLVWWIGARLMDERERDCDEAVLRQGSQPGVYARGIVQVCETYVESPLACAPGISPSSSRTRPEMA
jgi:bla regulator protein BlaR1